MRTVNKVILIGNVTRDPVIKQTQSGHKVAIFGLATNREWITQGQEKKKTTEFHEIIAWTGWADLCDKYIRKGKLLYIEGYLKTRRIDTPEGVIKYKKEIIIQDLIMLDKRQTKDLPAPATEIPAVEATPTSDTF